MPVLNDESGTAALDIIWGAKAIGKTIHRTPRQVNHLLDQGVLPARKVGGRWCASLAELQRFFAPAPSGEAA